MTLWLVRHAPVQAPPGLCYGRSDLPAQPDATAQAAQTLAAALPGGLPKGLRLRTSPLQRCEQLALALQALRPDLIVEPDARLREMDFGRWEGLPWADIPRADIDAWLADFANARPAGDGEPVRAFMARVAEAWDAHRAQRADAVWITHAGVMRAVLLLARGVRVPAEAADWPVDALAFGELLYLPG